MFLFYNRLIIFFIFIIFFIIICFTFTGFSVICFRFFIIFIAVVFVIQRFMHLYRHDNQDDNQNHNNCSQNDQRCLHHLILTLHAGNCLTAVCSIQKCLHLILVSGIVIIQIKNLISVRICFLDKCVLLIRCRCCACRSG